MSIPDFRYHRDPVETGSVVASDTACDVCRKVRGWIYVGPIYSASVDEAVACVWCVADGSAARMLDAMFTDPHPWADDVQATVSDVVLTRTPGFVGWQQERWFAHCGDAARFLGPVGSAELADLPTAAAAAIRAEAETTQQSTVGELDQYMDSLDRDGMPTGYLFQCLRCGTYLGYSDYT